MTLDKACIDNHSVSIKSIKEGLFISINTEKEELKVVYPPSVLEDETAWDWSSNWNWWKGWGQTQYSQWLFRFNENKDFLLFAQRNYLKEVFEYYNPANAELFEESNCPWDMDHIIPKNWISGKWGSEREFCKQWLDNIGNFAAIPFEINRSKSNYSIWDEYKKYSKELLFHNDFTKINNTLTRSEEISNTFASSVKNRMIHIYKSWYNELNISKLLSFEEINNQKINKRRKLFLKVMESLDEDASCYFFHNNHEYKISDENDIHFYKHWLLAGKVIKDKYFVCVCSNSETYEIGVRKHPHEDEIDPNNQHEELNYFADQTDNHFEKCNKDYWYIYRCEKSVPVPETLINELKLLITKIYT